MQLFEDNKYPVMFWSNPDMPVATTLAFTQEDVRRLESEGWLLRPIHREYPKHIPTGEVKRVKSVYDLGETEVPVTVVVNDEKEEAAALKKYAKAQVAGESEEVAPVVRRGRPPRVQIEEPVTA